MYYLIWKTQSSHAATEEKYATIHAAIKEFERTLPNLRVHSGGMVMISEGEDRGAAIVRWEEHISGGYGSGTAWADVNPAENLNKDCKNEGCCWHGHDEENEQMCADCERAGLDMVLDFLLK